jgi:3-deoxy-D-manno-octulosonic-acid transferase
MIGAIRFFYNLLFPLVLLAMLPAFILRMVRRGQYRHKFWQRFAIYSPGVRAKIADTGRIWIHAVSVGEVNIALKLIHEFRAADADASFVLSTTTSTGFKLAATRKTSWLEPIYNPLDFLPIARRAVRLIRPRLLILIEAEVWPNIVCEARRTGARAVLANTRLSHRSEKRFRLARAITAPIFNQLDTLCLQEEADRPRWLALGIEPEKLRVTGSIKFDDAANAPRPVRDFRPVLDSLGIPPEAPVLLGGSTFPGEEKILAETLRSLRRKFPNLFLILVPRHQERGDSVARELAALGFTVARRSRSDATQRPDILLVDTTGELASWYLLATAVFIGKSLCARGGQNPAEAITAGAPIVFGPEMQNFETLAETLLRENAAIQIHDAPSLENATARLLESPALRESMVQRAAQCLLAHRGATRRTIEILRNALAARESLKK